MTYEIRRIRSYPIFILLFFCTIPIILGGVLAFMNPRPIRLFLLGDSISLQYMPYLQTDLSDNFIIENKQDDGETMKNLDIPRGSNGGDSHMVLEYLKIKVKDPSFQPDVLLLNCGLHDIKRDAASHALAVPPEQYRQNLQDIFLLLNKKHIPVIWIRTTEVVDSIHAKNKEFGRFAKDLEQYNSIADEVAMKYQVPEIDLYSFTKKLGANRYADHVHYNDNVKALQGAFIAGYMSKWRKKD